MAFEVPEGWESYYRIIKASYEALISARTIQGVNKTRLDAWYNNFKTAEEKYFAAHLLDSLVFRSEDMIKSACKQIVSKKLPQILVKLGIATTLIEQFQKDLTIGKNKDIIFVPVKLDTPGKSSDVLIRQFKQVNNISNDRLVYPEAIEQLTAESKFIVFIDDICGTGSQFCRFYREHDLARLVQEKELTLIYIPLMAHRKGIEKLNRDCPDLLLNPLEILNDKHNFFREDPDKVGSNLWFKDKINRVEDVQNFYKNLLINNEINIAKTYGTGGLGLTVFTNFSSPNNSLHIFYTDKNEKWSPLFGR
jgi:hypothetical protein